MNKKERSERFNSFMNYNCISAEEANKILDILDDLDDKREAMSQEEIMAYAAKIRPVMRGNEDSLFWAESTNIATQSCSFNAKLIREAVGLKEVGRIVSYHKYGGYHMFLRPSADEAIWQCPKEILDKVCAFEFHAPSLNVSDIYNRALDRHVLVTIYYEGTVPEDIAAQPIKW